MVVGWADRNGPIVVGQVEQANEAVRERDLPRGRDAHRRRGSRRARQQTAFPLRRHSHSDGLPTREKSAGRETFLQQVIGEDTEEKGGRGLGVAPRPNLLELGLGHALGQPFDHLLEGDLALSCEGGAPGACLPKDLLHQCCV